MAGQPRCGHANEAVLINGLPRPDSDGLQSSTPEFPCTPNRGDRIELLRPHLGVRSRGIVFYADQLQVLVKWDDGRSQSLRAGAQVFRIVEQAEAELVQ
jgi:hypothetical protein